MSGGADLTAAGLPARCAIASASVLPGSLRVPDISTPHPGGPGRMLGTRVDSPSASLHVSARWSRRDTWKRSVSADPFEQLICTGQENPHLGLRGCRIEGKRLDRCVSGFASSPSARWDAGTPRVQAADLVVL